MYEGFQYVSENGILLRTDYRDFDRRKDECRYDRNTMRSRAVLKDIGYVEHDGRTNEEMRELVARQPISIGMRTTGMLNMYDGGIMNENYLHCSSREQEVNHGVLMVGYGTTDASEKDQNYGKCKDYWIIRNSWGPDWGE